MPKYDFECEDCKKNFERYLPYDRRNDSQQCPLCPSWSTVRLISLPGIGKGSSAENSSRYDISSDCCSQGGCDC